MKSFQRDSGMPGGLGGFGSPGGGGCLEVLEERVAPAVLVVTNALDDGSAGSLRSVLNQANSTPVKDTIVFDKAVFSSSTPQKVTLTSELAITEPVVIKGPGRDALTISGGGAFRVFNIDNGVPSAMLVKISGVTVAEGKAAFGGGILSQESLILDRVAVVDCQATAGSGGGLAVSGAKVLEISNSLITGNTSTSGSGAGLLANIDGEVKISGSVIAQNYASQKGGGAFVVVTAAAKPNSVLAIENCQVNSNACGDDGGGLALSNQAASGVGKAVVRGCKISDNTGLNGAGLFMGQGKFEVVGSKISGNTASGAGGGMVTYLGNQGLAIKNCLIVGNSAASVGGGIATTFSNPVKLVKTTVLNNFATSGGGGIFLNVPENLEMSGVNFVGNATDGSGGGLFKTGGLEAATLTGVRFEGNTAGDDGGGMHLNGLSEVVKVRGSEFLGNSADGGGAISVTPGAVLELSKSKLMGNSSTDVAKGGGAVLCNNPGKVMISGCVFEMNQSAGEGGAVNFLNVGTQPLVVSTSKFASNSAVTLGGGIFVQATVGFDLERCVFEFNLAAKGGGVALLQSGTKDLVGNRFSGNCAISEGGAIFIGATSGPVKIFRGAIIGNAAGDNNGGIASSTAPVIENVRIVDNVAPLNPNL